MSDREALEQINAIFDGTLVKIGPDAGKRSGMNVSSVREVVAILARTLRHAEATGEEKP